MSTRRTPVQERSNDTVQHIIKAASTLLRTLPLDQITTSRIAAQAGVSVGGLYRFFPDKQSIVDAIAVRHIEEFQRAVEQRLSAVDLDGPGLLFLIIDLYTEFLDAHPDFRSIALGRHVSALTRQKQVHGSEGPASILKLFLPDGSDFDLKLRVAIETGERLIDYAFNQTDRCERQRIIEELKKILCSYLFNC